MFHSIQSGLFGFHAQSFERRSPILSSGLPRLLGHAVGHVRQSPPKKGQPQFQPYSLNENLRNLGRRRRGERKSRLKQKLFEQTHIHNPYVQLAHVIMRVSMVKYCQHDCQHLLFISRQYECRHEMYVKSCKKERTT